MIQDIPQGDDVEGVCFQGHALHRRAQHGEGSPLPSCPGVMLAQLQRHHFPAVLLGEQGKGAIATAVIQDPTRVAEAPKGSECAENSGLLACSSLHLCRSE